MRKTNNRSFSSIMDDDDKPTSKPSTGRPPQLNMVVTPELKKRLERAIFWKGKNSNQLAYLTAAVLAALDKDPDAERPIPGEGE